MINLIYYIHCDGVACFAVLKPAVDLVCDPHYLNSKLYGWLAYKEHLAAKAKRKYLYAATYELFMEMIEQCEDIEQLKHIRFILRLLIILDYRLPLD